MVAGLRADRGAVRALSERWVEQSLARGDTGRLLEPLLVSLLNPATARVSVLHASIKQSLAPSDQVTIPVVPVSTVSSVPITWIQLPLSSFDGYQCSNDPFPVLTVTSVPITLFQF